VSHLRGISGVPSFSFPFGLFDDSSRRIVSQYHLSARTGVWGVNADSLREEEFSALRAIGASPPFDMDAINGFVQEAADTRGWIIVYFHSIDRQNRSGPNTIPLFKFRKHLDFRQRKEGRIVDSTQRQVTAYARARQAARISCVRRNTDILEVRLDGIPRMHADRTWISVRLSLPAAWIGHEIVMKRPTGRMEKIRRSADSSLLVDIPTNGTSSIFAVE